MSNLATLSAVELRALSERDFKEALDAMSPPAIDRFRRMRKLKPEHEAALETFLRKNPEKRLTADNAKAAPVNLKAKTKHGKATPKKRAKHPARGATKIRVRADDDGYVKLWMRMRAWWDGVDLDAEAATPAKAPAPTRAPRPRMEIEVDNPAAILAQRLDITQKLWGAGNSLPGGERFLIDLIQDAKIAADARIADLSAGLGGPMRFLETRQKGAIKGFEQDKDLASAGQQISDELDLGDTMPISHFEPHAIERLFKASEFDLVLAREVFYSMPNRKAALGAIGEALDRNGNLIFTDFALANRNTENNALLAWRQSDPYKPCPATVEEYREVLNELKYSVKSIDDISNDYVQIIQTGWKSIIDHLKDDTFSRSYVDALMGEGQVWLDRCRAVESGQLRVIKCRAIMTKAPKRSLTDSMSID